MRRLVLSLALLVGSILTGLLLASVLLRQECPDCAGSTRYLAEHPSQCLDKPAVLDCPRCADRGLVSLLNARVGPDPDPLIAALLRHSNRETWGSRNLRHLLDARLKESGLRPATGDLGKARFLDGHGASYVLLLLSQNFRMGPETAPVQAILFDIRGSVRDSMDLTVFGGRSHPTLDFIIPAGKDGLCARVRLLTWKNDPCDRIEIDHAGMLWKGKPQENEEKLGLLEWSVHLRDGRLQIRDGRGNSIAE